MFILGDYKSDIYFTKLFPQCINVYCMTTVGGMHENYNDVYDR